MTFTTILVEWFHNKELTNMQLTKVNINKNDIFNYVVGNSQYDAIEKCIDPERYEVFDEFIYDHETKESIAQSDEYSIYCKQVSLLRRNAKDMERDEIERICEELQEIAPKHISL